MSQVTGFGYSVGPRNRKRPKMGVATLFISDTKCTLSLHITCLIMTLKGYSPVHNDGPTILSV